MFLESSHQLYTLRPNVIENSVVNAWK
jgi:hypothetical protein